MATAGDGDRATRAAAGRHGEQDLLTAAQRGDEHAFGRLVAPYRRELHAHAYRMVGSAADADDVLQDALLGAWRGLARFERRSSLRSWLHTITANASLKTLRRRPKRMLPTDRGPAAELGAALREPLAESTWIEPMPDEQLLAAADERADPEARYEQRESVELAFVAALQLLPARQRAVLILRDVLGFSAREAAEMLETSSTAIDSALQRAHKTMRERLPDASQQATLRALGDGGLRAVVDAYVRAMEAADVDAIAAMLTEDAALAMPPLRDWFSGVEAIADFYTRLDLSQWSRRMIPTRANGQPAVGHYVWDEEAQAFLPHAIHTLALDGARVREIVVFQLPVGMFARFDLPERIAADAA